jgi:DNA-binding transcriptional regulator YhcF (GntR family)
MVWPTFENTEPKTDDSPHWQPEHIVEIEQKNLLAIAEKICAPARHPYLTLRILVHIICGIEADGYIHISARHLSKKLGVHYDTATKCIKYLREKGILRAEKHGVGATLRQGKKSYRINPRIAASKAARAKIPDYDPMNIAVSHE